MKVNISCGASNMVDRPKKSMKLLSHFKKEADAEDFEAVQQKFNASFGSVDSNIQILEGSFSKLKPINAKRAKTSISSDPPVVDRPGKSIKLLPHFKKDPEADEFQILQEEVNANFSSANFGIKVLNGSKRAETSAGGVSVPSTSFKPTTTSTPYHYDNISDVEDENKNIQDTVEDEVSNITFNYQQDVLEENESCSVYIINKTKKMVDAKSKKKCELLKKLSKYQKKVKNVESALMHVDKVISFGNQVPILLENCPE